jgi:hypothetical protein
VVESPPSLTTPGLVVSPFGQAHFLPGPLLLDHQPEGHQISSGQPALGRAPAYPLYEAQNEFLRRFLNFRHPGGAQRGENRFWSRWRRFSGLRRGHRMSGIKVYDRAGRITLSFLTSNSIKQLANGIS